jgi:hypothetical protein
MVHPIENNTSQPAPPSGNLLTEIFDGGYLFHAQSPEAVAKIAEFRSMDRAARDALFVDALVEIALRAVPDEPSNPIVESN